MTNANQDAAFDVVVLGAGPVGENVADRAVQGGLSVALVEHELVGGECSYWACMPTKALLRDAAAVRAARALPGAGRAVDAELDVAAVLRRRDAFASDWTDTGQVKWLDQAGIVLFRGHGRIIGAGAVTVTETDTDEPTLLLARHAVVVATGTSARIPAIPGLAEAAPWTSRDAAAANHVPDRLAIIGGGVVGSELATAFRGLGAQVTLVSNTRLLPGVEPFASDQVTDALRASGVTVEPDIDVVEVRRDASGTVRVALGDGRCVTADEVVVATGRIPNTNDIGLDLIGGTPGDWLVVDDDLAVVDDDGEPIGGRWLYAAGDVNGRAMLTHHGKYQARALGDAIVARAHGDEPDLRAWGRHAATADERAVTQVIFTDPEVATVGLSAKVASASGMATRIVDHDLGAVAGAALHADGYRGRARMVIDAERNTLIGFTAVGPDVAELLHAATIAIAGEVPLDRLWHAVPAFPTISEIWLRLLEADGRDH